MWNREAQLFNENYPLWCMGVKSVTLTRLVTGSLSTLTTSPSKLSTWNTWQPHLRIFGGCYWDCKHDLFFRYLPGKSVEIADAVSGYHQKKKKPSLWWMSKCTISTLSSVTASCRELEKKSRHTQSSMSWRRWSTLVGRRPSRQSQS